MDLSPREQTAVRRFSESRKGGLGGLLRSSIYCTVLAGLFLYLALARNKPLYSIGIFGMFVLYLAIRVYSTASPELCRAAAHFAALRIAYQRSWKPGCVRSRAIN